MKMLVVATDGSPSAQVALEAAIALARESDGELRCVSVDDALAAEGLDPGVTRAADDAARAAREAGVAATAVTRTGTAVQEVIAVADDCDADVIIVGSRGRGPVTSRLFGSVARGLVHKSRRPVTVVTATTHTSAPD